MTTARIGEFVCVSLLAIGSVLGASESGRCAEAQPTIVTVFSERGLMVNELRRLNFTKPATARRIGYELVVTNTQAAQHRLDHVLARFKPVISLTLTDDTVHTRELEWLKRLSDVEAATIRGRKLTSGVIDLLGNACCLEYLVFERMTVRGDDLHRVKQFPHLANIRLRGCEIKGNILQTLHEIGWDGRIELESDLPLPHERRYLQMHHAELPFDVYIDTPK